MYFISDNFNKNTFFQGRIVTFSYCSDIFNKKNWIVSSSLA